MKKPLSAEIQECEWRSVSFEPTSRQYAQENLGLKPCYQRSTEKVLVGSDAPLGTEPLIIQYSLTAKPDLVRFDRLTVQLLEGVVHTVSVATAGVSHQAQAVKALTSELGPPTQQKRTPRKSQTGEFAEVIEATWNRPQNTRVQYAGAVGADFEQGYAEASTTEGMAYIKQRVEAIHRNEPVR